MQTLISILIILLFASCAYADTEVIVVGQPLVSGRTLQFSENFSAIVDNEEWDDDGNWTEYTASTDKFIGDDAQYNSSLYSGLMVGGYSSYLCYRGFTTDTYVSGEFYYRFDSNPTANSALVSVNLSNLDSDIIMYLVIGTSGYLRILDNAAYTTISTSTVADTWYKIEWQINTGQTDGIDAIRVWVDGTEGLERPYDTYSRRNPRGSDTIVYRAWDDVISQWVDDIQVYQGARP